MKGILELELMIVIYNISTYILDIEEIQRDLVLII